jgi:hypothetical protein
MLPKISTSDKFKEEIKFFYDKAAKLEEPKKTKVRKKIEDLKRLVAEIDIGYDSYYNGYVTPTLLVDKRNDMIKLRKNILKNLNNA